MPREFPAVIALAAILGVAFAAIEDLSVGSTPGSASVAPDRLDLAEIDEDRASIYEAICSDMRRTDPPDYGKVNRAASELRGFLMTAPPSDVPIITRLLEREPEYSTRRSLVQGLAVIGGPEALRAVEDHLWRVIARDDDVTGVEAVTTIREGLGQFSGLAVDRLVGWASWGPPGLEAYALEALSLVPAVHRESAVEPLGSALSDSNPTIRKGAAIGLSGMRSAGGMLADRLAVEPDLEVAGAIIQSLGAAKNPKTIPAILEATRQHPESTALGWVATDAIEACGGPEAIEALMEIHREGASPRVRARAFQAAERIRARWDRNAMPPGRRRN